MTTPTWLRRETVARLLAGCGVAILLCTAGIVRDVGAQKPKPKPTEDFLISCQRCYDAYPAWWCVWIWDCPPKPPDPPSGEGGDSSTATTKKPVKK